MYGSAETLSILHLATRHRLDRTRSSLVFLVTGDGPSVMDVHVLQVIQLNLPLEAYTRSSRVLHIAHLYVFYRILDTNVFPVIADVPFMEFC